MSATLRVMGTKGCGRVHTSSWRPRPTGRVQRLWLRLQRAVELFAAGTPLTEAAHAAGFADSAHLSRTFRRMFGIAAATLRVS